MACGGDGDSGTSTTCVTYEHVGMGIWVPSYNLAVARSHMVSWASYQGEYDDGVLLMGGEWGDAATWTTDFLSSTQTQFNRLTYDTK